MRIRRCSGLAIEPRETLEFDLEDLLAGGDGCRATRRWIAWAPHLGAEVELERDEVLALGELSPSRWVEWHGDAGDAVARLLAKGLVVREQGDDPARDRDERLRARNWRVHALGLHYFTRWDGVDSERPAQGRTASTLSDLVDRYGPPPPAVHERSLPALRIPLALPEAGPFDALLRSRATCRNFERAPLARRSFDAILHRVFGAQAVAELAPGVPFLKKNHPSGGALHAIEPYLIVQRVEGIATGCYHYHALEHALEPVGPLASDLAQRAVAGQDYFADAPVLVVLALRFERAFWKYREHPKAYRALLLEAGHVSQTLYLAAAEAGLAAFVTAAINEIDLERALGLDPLDEGPVCVLGFGERADTRATVEFDPLGLAR